MSEWSVKRLKDYWEFNPKVKVNNEDEYSFIEMPDLIPGNKEVLPSRKRKAKGLTKFQNGDTLFAKITPCLENGKICQAQGLENNIGVGSTEFFVFRGKDGVSDNDFIHYLLKWYPIRKYAEKCMSGSAGHQRVPSDAFDGIDLPLPDFKESIEIAKILSNLDKKITLLRQQNQDLEELAQTLFKRWFVEFEFPNENGKPYKSSGGKMETSELGEIPKEWRLNRLDSLCEVINGRAYKNSEFKTEGTPIVRIQNVNGGNNYVYSDLELHPDKYINDDDLIFAWSATFGAFIWRGVKSIYHYHIWKLKCFNPESKLFLYLYLKRITESVTNQGTGSIFSHITKGLMESQELLIPSKNVLLSFNNMVSSLNKKISNNTKEILSLTQLRDTLLPKLMSGELRINN
ncbi:MAG: restriction endonuclease subunit S [Carboxylicivirga sp.]|jgi:type I restriction enzyme S subunit|nr:restriction endonuclease subunit S [Carboxylicivirga sp.]